MFFDHDTEDNHSLVALVKQAMAEEEDDETLPSKTSTTPQLTEFEVSIVNLPNLPSFSIVSMSLDVCAEFLDSLMWVHMYCSKIKDNNEHAS